MRYKVTNTPALMVGGWVYLTNTSTWLFLASNNRNCDIDPDTREYIVGADSLPLPRT